MGDNANKDWEWHNTEVGVGYAAPGVVRQRKTECATSKIVDMSKSPTADRENEESQAVSKSFKRGQGISNQEEDNRKETGGSSKKNKRSKHSEKDKSKHSPTPPGFNPFLQIFATQISDTTRHFSVD